MPIYEYRCEACGHELEALQKLSDDLLTDCPECQQSALKKKVSKAAFRLKGGGWYETDFKTGNKKNVAGDQSPADNKSESKDGKESKTVESKPDSNKSAAAGPAKAESKASD